MKKSETFFSILLVPLDYALILLAAVSAYKIRFSQWWIDIRPIIFDLPFQDYLNSAFIVAVLWIMVFAIAGLYQVKSSHHITQELRKIFFASSTGLALIAILIFFQRDLFDSRFIVMVAYVLAVVYVSLGRVIIRKIQRTLLKKGIGVYKIVLVGNSRTTDSFLTEFSANKKYGFKVVKRLRDFSLENSKELQQFIEDNEVDQIIQADPNLSKAEMMRLYDFATDNHIIFKYVADLLEVKVLRSEVAEVMGVPVVEVKRTTLEGWGRIGKRIFDIVASFILITIFSPLILITMLLIKIDSKGPIFFSRRDDGSIVTRIGEGGRPFNYFKFRSMIPNTDSMRYKELADKNVRGDGPMVKIKDDPRVTRVGRFIRRWSIDELPELFLVFIGRMSLVGPRPHLPEEVAKYENHQRKTLSVKPGITGLAQVSGRSDLSFEEEVKLDVYYIENWSLLFDISILFRTPLAVFKHREVE